MVDIVVASAQVACHQGDIAGNLAMHLHWVAEARIQEVDLLVFPELSLTDYLLEPDTTALARSVTCLELQQIAAAAGPMTVSVGFIERGSDGRVYNAQALLADGCCRHVHRKLNLPTYGRLQEGRHFARGDRLATPAWREIWSLATLICADTWNPALPWLAALQGADILILPIASSLDAVGEAFDNPREWDLNLRHTAMTYGLPTIMANHCGRRGGLSFWGGSRILDPFGRELVRLGAEPGLGVARLRRADVCLARERLPTMRDADPHLVKAELDRILSRTLPQARPPR